MLSTLSRHRNLARISTTMLCMVQHREISSADAKPERISKNISFRAAFDSPIEQEKRPITVIYGWLVAKARHMHKYGDFYLGKGFDVLHIKIQPQQLLWPIKAQGVISDALQFLGQEGRTTQPIFVHGFSVGGYLYGETQVKMMNDPVHHPVGKRIVAQVYDSPVGYANIPEGVGKAITPVPLLQKTIRFTLESYMQVFYNHITKHYIRSEETCHKNPFKIPSLVLYSKADPVGLPGPIVHLIKTMEDNGAKVYSKCWNDSLHVSHFHQHPVEYIQQLNDFIDKVGLTTYAEENKLRSRAC